MRILFIEPNDEEFKLTMKDARTKLEVPMPILGDARENTLVLLMPTKAQDQG